MLRLSKKTDYALIALKDLASRTTGASSSARDIAGRYNIPVELMAKILQRLARRGILDSYQGIRGGYYLARPATEISVVQVINAIEGPITVTACSTTDDNCDQYSTCSIRDPLWRIKDRIVSALSACTIFELVVDAPVESLLPNTKNESPPIEFLSCASRTDH